MYSVNALHEDVISPFTLWVPESYSPTPLITQNVSILAEQCHYQTQHLAITGNFISHADVPGTDGMANSSCPHSPLWRPGDLLPRVSGRSQKQKVKRHVKHLISEKSNSGSPKGAAERGAWDICSVRSLWPEVSFLVSSGLQEWVFLLCVVWWKHVASRKSNHAQPWSDAQTVHLD